MTRVQSMEYLRYGHSLVRQVSPVRNVSPVGTVRAAPAPSPYKPGPPEGEGGGLIGGLIAGIAGLFGASDDQDSPSPVNRYRGQSGFHMQPTSATQQNLAPRQRGPRDVDLLLSRAIMYGFVTEDKAAVLRRNLVNGGSTDLISLLAQQVHQAEMQAAAGTAGRQSQSVRTQRQLGRSGSEAFGINESGQVRTASPPSHWSSSNAALPASMGPALASSPSASKRLNVQHPRPGEEPRGASPTQMPIPRPRTLSGAGLSKSPTRTQDVRGRVSTGHDAASMGFVPVTGGDTTITGNGASTSVAAAGYPNSERWHGRHIFGGTSVHGVDGGPMPVSGMVASSSLRRPGSKEAPSKPPPQQLTNQLLVMATRGELAGQHPAAASGVVGDANAALRKGTSRSPRASVALPHGSTLHTREQSRGAPGNWARPATQAHGASLQLSPPSPQQVPAIEGLARSLSSSPTKREVVFSWNPPGEMPVTGQMMSQGCSASTEARALHSPLSGMLSHHRGTSWQAGSSRHTMTGPCSSRANANGPSVATGLSSIAPCLSGGPPMKDAVGTRIPGRGDYADHAMSPALAALQYGRSDRMEAPGAASSSFSVAPGGNVASPVGAAALPVGLPGRTSLELPIRSAASGLPPTSGATAGFPPTSGATARGCSTSNATGGSGLQNPARPSLTEAFLKELNASQAKPPPAAAAKETSSRPAEEPAATGRERKTPEGTQTLLAMLESTLKGSLSKHKEASTRKPANEVGKGARPVKDSTAYDFNNISAADARNWTREEALASAAAALAAIREPKPEPGACSLDEPEKQDKRRRKPSRNTRPREDEEFCLRAPTDITAGDVLIGMVEQARDRDHRKLQIDLPFPENVDADKYFDVNFVATTTDPEFDPPATIDEFVWSWGLDEDTADWLLSFPEQVQANVIVEFKPNIWPRAKVLAVETFEAMQDEEFRIQEENRAARLANAGNEDVDNQQTGQHSNQQASAIAPIPHLLESATALLAYKISTERKQAQQQGTAYEGPTWLQDRFRIPHEEKAREHVAKAETLAKPMVAGMLEAPAWMLEPEDPTMPVEAPAWLREATVSARV